MDAHSKIITIDDMAGIENTPLQTSPPRLREA